MAWPPWIPAIPDERVNTNGWSMVVVSGAAWVDAAQVPHGAVAAVTYYSKALSRNRRMHVYTPPGYELGKGKFLFSIFYMGQVTATIRGHQWAGPASSSTT